MSLLAEVIDVAPGLVRGRLRMSDAHGWLLCVRRPGHPRADHWSVVAVELDTDLRRPVGVLVPMQAPGRPFGLTDEAAGALDEALARHAAEHPGADGSGQAAA